jgi:hypothetical protein
MLAPLRTIIVILATAFWWTPPGLAQDAPKDDALDKLLKKLEEGQPPAVKAADPKAKSDGPAKKDGAKPGDVAPKDQALDSLLEKLGETGETPAPSGRGGGHGEPAQPPTGPGQDGELKGKAKDLDEHLEELTGRRRKKKDGDGEGSGPLSDVIKQMREVEERLGKPDTGEDTRQRQGQIVKKLDTIIEQLKNSSGQGQGRMVIREVRQAGQKPGNQKGGPGASGNAAQGVGPMKPAKPATQSVVAVDKHVWGHLPDELRGVMNNVFKEEALPDKADVIRRYYLSVSKKGQSREE